MAEESFQERTEPATPKRREEARRKGQVGKSREVSSLAILVSGILFFFFGGGWLLKNLTSFMIATFSGLSFAPLQDTNVVVRLKESAEFFMKVVLPFMSVLGSVAILANLVQTGLIWSVEPLAPKASKINPIEGAKRIISKRSLVELAKSIAKILIVGWAAFSVLKGELNHLIQLGYYDKWQIMAYMGETSLRVAARSCYVIALLALLDFIYQRWEYEQSLKMTKQEVKEEFKQTEGDPLVKSRIRSLQREMARRRMMEEVKQADVVITNPVHLAVALHYEAQEMTAPKVVAKGAEKIAEKIKETAKAHNVPIVEDRTLAQNLYKSVDIGQEIPSQFYHAVAEILAYVYGLKNKV